MNNNHLSHKLLHTASQYLYKRSATYYFRRRVPEDVQRHYKSKVICRSLRTTSHSIALRGASVLAHQYESQWMTLRLGTGTTIPAPVKALSPSLNFHEALELYLRLKSKGKPLTFESSAVRNVNYLVDAVGDKDLTDYTSIDAGKFRDYLLNRRLSSSSVKRVFSSIKAIYNLASSEHGIESNSPFANVYFPEADDVVKRQPVSPHDLETIKSSCLKLNDDVRWLIALIADTGMRLSEAAGLYWRDVHLDCSIPYIEVKPNPHRRLKTNSSIRTLPLVGLSLWALQQAKVVSDSPIVFPRYMKQGICNANSASAAINKWIKTQVTASVSVHSLRHSMRDRLRAIQCPTEIIDACGGWRTDSVGSRYGAGYPIEVLQEWMLKM